MKSLTLTRRLVILDVETTGLDTDTDRIVELAVLCHEPQFIHHHLFRLNPGEPIPARATAVHGITDDDVIDMPSFGEIAQDLLDWLYEADWAGWNLRRYDLVVIQNELRRFGYDLPPAARTHLLDPMDRYHAEVKYRRGHPRNLESALQYYCHRSLFEVHTAFLDAFATQLILDAQLARLATAEGHPLPMSVAQAVALLEVGWAERW
jgi:DNA polymerase III subunit epsilon